MTAAEPPPERTPTSARGPMTAMDATPGEKGQGPVVLEEDGALLGDGLGAARFAAVSGTPGAVGWS